MSFIDSNYTELTSNCHGFYGGLTSWTSANTDGAASVTTETTGGGRAVLSTGTTAIDDDAQIRLDPVTPDSGTGADAISLRFVFALNAGAADPGTAQVQFGGFNVSTGNRIYHQPNHNNSAARDTLRFASSSGQTNIPTRVARPRDPIENELLWDFADSTVYHRYQDIYAQSVTDANILPDPTAELVPLASVRTADTSADRVLYLYEVEVAYYDRRTQ